MRAFIGKITGVVGGVKDWLKATHTEDGTKPSYSRMASSFIVVNTIAFVWVSMAKNHWVIPDLTTPGIFIATAAGIHYGVNQVQGMIAAYKGNGNGNGTVNNSVQPPAPTV